MVAMVGPKFALVFVHDAMMYLASLDDLRAAAATAFAQVRPCLRGEQDH